jgi:hypothetical protein
MEPNSALTGISWAWQQGAGLLEHLGELSGDRPLALAAQLMDAAGELATACDGWAAGSTLAGSRFAADSMAGHVPGALTKVARW